MYYKESVCHLGFIALLTCYPKLAICVYDTGISMPSCTKVPNLDCLQCSHHGKLKLTVPFSLAKSLIFHFRTPVSSFLIHFGTVHPQSAYFVPSCDSNGFHSDAWHLQQISPFPSPGLYYNKVGTTSNCIINKQLYLYYSLKRHKNQDSSFMGSFLCSNFLIMSLFHLVHQRRSTINQTPV